ncbi:MAG: glycosyl hydrolase [bacterium JZ-2024 1]
MPVPARHELHPTIAHFCPKLGMVLPRRLWIVKFVTLLALAMATHCSAQSISVPRYGLNLFLARRYAPQEYQDVLETIREGNVRLVREEVSLSEVFEERGADFSRYDRAFTALRREQIYPLILLSDPPAEWSIEELPDRLVEAVSHLRKYSRHFQILNEVNTARFWRRYPEPSAYAVLMKSFYAKLKGRFPEVTVISAGLASPDLPYLKAALDAGLADGVDAFAIHPYTFPLPLRGPVEDLVADFIQMVAPKPVWITEIGWPTGATSQSVDYNQQAMFLEEALMRLSPIQEVQAILWYDFRDSNDPNSDVEGRFGLVEFDLTPKPAWKSLVTRFTHESGIPLIIEEIIADKPEVFLTEGFQAEVDLSHVTGKGNAIAVEISGLARVEQTGNCARAFVKLDPPGPMLGFYLKDRSGEIFSGLVERVLWEGEREIIWPIIYRHEKDYRPVFPMTFEGFLVQPVDLYTPTPITKVTLTVRDLRMCVWTPTVRTLSPVN